MHRPGPQLQGSGGVRLRIMTMRRNALSRLVAFVFFLAVLSCGERPAGDGQDGEVLRVALLTAGPVSDAGWNAGAYEGLLLLRDSLGARVSYQQTSTPSEFDEAFLAYGSQGYDLVFAHGFEYQDAALRAAEKHPGTTFVVSGGGRSAANLIPLIFALNEGSYLAGIVAGGLTETNAVGMLGGVDIPPVLGTFRAFEAGTRSFVPAVRVLEAFTGNWDDVAAAKEGAAAQLAQGADVILHNVDAASFGVFQAVREERDRGRRAWALGMNRDQNHVAPELVLGSAVIRTSKAFLAVAEALVANELDGAPVRFGIRSGVVDFVFNPALDVVPEEVADAVAQARKAIAAGELEVPEIRYVEERESGF